MPMKKLIGVDYTNNFNIPICYTRRIKTMSINNQDPVILFCSTAWLAQSWIDVLSLTGFRPVNFQVNGFSTWIVCDDLGRILRENREVV